MAHLPSGLPTQGSIAYTASNNTLHSTIKNDPHDLLEVEIGDSKQPIFYPRMKIKRWNNEVNFSLGLIDDPTNAQVLYQGNKVVYKNNGLEAHFYDLPQTTDGQFEDGGHEFEVLLNKKPTSNVLQFSLQTKGLDFLYQGALTPEEIAKGAVRPTIDNITGSYAVYHSTQQGDYSLMGKNNYKSGKAFHIYRPKATDKSGNTVWCDLNVDTNRNTLSVTVPQSFIDSAVYPILVDPTFGYSTIGATFQSFSGSELVGYRFTAASDVGTIRKLTTYIGNGFSGTYNIKGVICDTTPNIVTNGISPSLGGYSETTNQWVSTGTYTSIPTISASTDYYLCFVSDKAVYFKYDTGTTNYGISDTGNSYTSPINPSGSKTFNSRKMSMYATYAPSGYAYVKTVTTTAFATSVTSMPVNLPASIVSGQLLIALVEVRNSGTWTKPTGWSDISTLSQTGGGGGVGKLNGFYRIADGTEGSTATWTAGTSTTGIWQVLQINNWDGTAPPEATTTSGDSSAANPPSESPSWGAANNLWIAVAGHAASTTAAWSAGPSGYDSFEDDGASSGGAAVSLATAVNYTSASSEDPGAFTVSGSNRFWAAATMAVKPSGGGGGGGTNYTQECDETLTITDTRTNSVGKVLSQVITTTPTFLRATTKSAFTETITVTPTYKNQTQKPFSESITITNPTVITKIVGKTFSESSTITDTFIRQTTKVLTETITLVQVYLNQTTKILSESITTTDTLVKSLIQTLLLSETLTITSTLSRQATKVLSETITLGNTLIKQITYILTESITITATVLKKPSRALTESIIITSVFIRSSTKVLHETLTLTASLIDQLSRSLTETLTISDSVSHLKTMFSTLTETLTIVPSFIRQTSKTFTETLTFLDTLLRQATKVLTDTFTLTDTMQETKGNKIFSETLTITDTLANQTSKTLSEVITIIDTQIRTISKTLSDTITLTASSINQGIKVLSETVTLTDTFTTKILGKFFTETITVVEKYISYHNGVRGLWGKMTKTITNWTQKAKPSGSWTKKPKRHG